MSTGKDPSLRNIEFAMVLKGDSDRTDLSFLEKSERNSLISIHEKCEQRLECDLGSERHRRIEITQYGNTWGDLLRSWKFVQ